MKPIPPSHTPRRSKRRSSTSPRRAFTGGAVRVYHPLRADADTYAAITMMARADGVSRVAWLAQLVSAELTRRGRVLMYPLIEAAE